jgi:cytochrome c oxidase subunit 2
MLERFLRKIALMGLAGLVLSLVGMGTAMALSGQATPLQIGMQDPATPVAVEIHNFYSLVNTIIVAIAIFVLILMLLVMFRFSENRNPTPSKTAHHTMLEVAWTVVPIFILIVIAIPSFKLLSLQYTYPAPQLTIKATGNAWNWTHEYPDLGGVTVDSVMLTDRDVLEAKLGADELKKRYAGLSDLEVTRRMKADAAPIWYERKQPRMLAVDNEIVVPVNKVVHVLVTASDVIHSWTVPAFGANTDAVPGRITSTWFQATQTGMFYGDCTQLCGKDHSAMPIAVRVVSDQVWADWSAAMKAKDKKKAKAVIEKAALEDGGLKTVADASK